MMMRRSVYERLRNKYVAGDVKACAKLIEAGDVTVSNIMEDFEDCMLWDAFDLLNLLVEEGPKIPRKDVGNLSRMRFHWFMWGIDNKMIPGW